ncbi:LysR family transcriptional regulator, partial [Rhizobium sp. PRIMUS64]|nr:LysR family transcriptional regulator [Rhizobium sp. PRIMUS64]
KVRPLVPETIGLPDLPTLGLVLHRAEAEPQPAVARLAELVLLSVHGALREVLA